MPVNLFAETALKYSILDERIIDDPLKTQVLLEILVEGDITKETLSSLFKQLYASTLKRTGFKFHTNPTNVYFYAYVSKAHYESKRGQQIAMLDKGYYDGVYTIYFHEGQLESLGKLPEKKFGFEEEKRRQIWEEFVQAGDSGRLESKKMYPLPDILSRDYSQELYNVQSEKQYALENELRKKYTRELQNKYELTDEQLTEIVGEGDQKNWPTPKYTEGN